VVQRVEIPELIIEPMTEDRMDAVLVMWKKLLDMTAKVNSRYQLAPDAVENQRTFFQSYQSSPLVFCFLARINDEPVGFANGYLIQPTKIFKSKTIGLIENLFVEDLHRRKGIARGLVQKCYDWFEQVDVDEYYVNVVPANTLSEKFWKAMGYTVHKQTMVKTRS
jgi:predicted acetyltransferase